MPGVSGYLSNKTTNIPCGFSLGPPLDPRRRCLSTVVCVGIQAHSRSALSREKLSRTEHLSEYQAGHAAFV